MKDGSGYIKLFRSIRKWRYWPAETGKPFSRTEAWMDLLMSANHAEATVGRVSIGQGQFLTSQVKLADRWSWSRHRVQDFLRDLSSPIDGEVPEISTLSGTPYTLITICKYDDYQAKPGGGGQVFGQQRGTSGALQGHKQEELKNGKGTKEEAVSDSLTDDEVMEAYNRICLSFPKIRKIDGARSSLIKYASSDIDDWPEFFTTAEASGEWLKSQNFVDFEWLLKNRLKILEGKFQDKKKPQRDRSNDCVPR